MSVAICFLARGGDGGLAALEAFAESWHRNPPGYANCRLYIVSKNWGAEIAAVQKIAFSLNAEVIDVVDDSGFDWGAYFRALPSLKEDHVCFLNTHSRIAKDNWLSMLMQHALKPDVGVAGCTANWRTMARTAFSILPIAKDFARRNGIGRGVFYFFKAWALLLACYPKHVFYPRFPNPHLRSNAFVMRRDLFAEFATRNTIPVTKHDALLLENGRNGLTRFVKKKGLKALVVNDAGEGFDTDRYPESRTFFNPAREAYLVADNQTRFYKGSDIWQRRISEILSWGNVMSKIQSEAHESACPHCHGPAEPYLSGKDYYREISDVTFHLHRCTQCELLFVANPPKDLGRYYAQTYYPHPKTMDEFRQKRLSKKQNLEVLLNHKQSGDLLEIGPSVGYFLSLARDAGFNVKAVEMDPQCVDFLRNELKIDTIQSDNPGQVLTEDETQYDVICLWHVIEHIADPWTIVEQGAKRLKPGGVLLFAAPNPLSDQAKLMGKYWPHHDLPRHLSGVSMPWLKTVAMKNGLTTVLETTQNDESLMLNKVSWAMIFKKWAKGLPNKVQALFYYIGYGFSYLFLPWDNIELHGSCYVMIFQKPGTE